MAAAVTAWGRTAVEEHNALNAQITVLPTDLVQSLNRLRNFYYVFFSRNNSLFTGVSIAGSLVEKLVFYR